MPCRFVLPALLLCSGLVSAADLVTLSGKVVKGEIVGLTGQEVVIQSGTERIATPVDQVLHVDIDKLGSLSNLKYKDVELIDGTLLHCKEFKLKGNEVELTLLLPGQTVKLSLSAVSYYLNDAQDEKVRKDWQERFLSKKKNRDILALKQDDVVHRLEGTFGEGDDKGETIKFERSSGGAPIPVKLERIQGMVFIRQAGDVPIPFCKLSDTTRNLIIAAEVSLGESGFSVTTLSGAKLTYARDQVSRLDFSKGKLTFLSDLDPVRVVETSTQEFVEHYRRDRNLDDGPMRLAGRSYAKGLALHARTELEYDLGGEYNEFEAYVGVDDLVGGSDGPTLVKIEGDGRELWSAAVTRRDVVVRRLRMEYLLVFSGPLLTASPWDAPWTGLAMSSQKDLSRQARFSVKDVKRLRIVVVSGDLLDLGKHVDLADAKVRK